MAKHKYKYMPEWLTALSEMFSIARAAGDSKIPASQHVKIMVSCPDRKGKIQEFELWGPPDLNITDGHLSRKAVKA